MTREELIGSYQGYGAVVFRRCCQILGNAHDSRDASQEVFERCLRRCGELRPGPELLAWLYKVSTNLCLDRLRKQRQEVASASDDDLADLGGVGETRLLYRDGVRRLLAAVAPRTREVAIYAYVDGMTHAEIAKLSGMTDRSVRNHLTRLRDTARSLGLQEDRHE
jgi:RNA polymerase sigma-70 factor (ECF subfamily)